MYGVGQGGAGNGRLPTQISKPLAGSTSTAGSVFWPLSRIDSTFIGTQLAMCTICRTTTVCWRRGLVDARRERFPRAAPVYFSWPTNNPEQYTTLLLCRVLSPAVNVPLPRWDMLVRRLGTSLASRTAFIACIMVDAGPTRDGRGMALTRA